MTIRRPRIGVNSHALRVMAHLKEEIPKATVYQIYLTRVDAWLSTRLGRNRIPVREAHVVRLTPFRFGEPKQEKRQKACAAPLNDSPTKIEPGYWIF